MSDTLSPSPPEAGAPVWLRSGLDGLRAAAVCWVLLAHGHQTPGFPDVGWLHALGRVGSVGVDVFFVLSGFLITTLLCREFDRYGLYLRQQVFLNPHHQAWWTTFPQNVLLAAVGAALSYRFVERPFLRIKGRLHAPTGGAVPATRRDHGEPEPVRVGGIV